MRACVQRSGGVALQAETFGAPHLRASLERFFGAGGRAAAKGGADRAGDLSLGYRCALELRTSKECAKARLLGGGGDEGLGTVSESDHGRTFSWSIGAVDEHFTAGVQLTRGSENIKAGQGDPSAAVMQLSATYRHADGGTRTRVSTLRMPRLTQEVRTTWHTRATSRKPRHGHTPPTQHPYLIACLPYSIPTL